MLRCFFLFFLWFVVFFVKGLSNLVPDLRMRFWLDVTRDPFVFCFALLHTGCSESLLHGTVLEGATWHSRCLEV